MSLPSPVGGASFQTSSAVTSLLNQYYYPTVGNFVVLFLQFSAAVTGLTVFNGATGGTVLTPGPVINNMYSFYGIASNTGSFYYWSASWTGSAYLGMTIEEYNLAKAATGFSPTNYATASGTSGTASISLTTDDAAGNLIVCGFGNASNNAFTATVGTERQQSTTYTARCQLLDNSNVSPGSLSCTSTLTSSAWDAIALELRFTVAAVPGFGGVTPRTLLQGLAKATVLQPLANNPTGPTPPSHGQGFPTGQQT